MTRRLERLGLRFLLWAFHATEADLKHEEDRLKERAKALRKQAYDIEDELLDPRFGWTDVPPPKSGVIETQGFHSVRTDDFGQHSATHFPGLVDASVYDIPSGTLWRPDQRNQ